LYRLREEKAEIQQFIVQLREEKIRLESEKILLETDYEYIEQLARERYRMDKPGEKVFKVVPKRKIG
jgi:cell division protein FtsB